VKTTYTTSGTCSRFIDIELEGKNIRQVRFVGGCSGNTQGVAALLKGMPVTEAISRLRGIQCRGGTSCPDQLARALDQLLLSQAS
jgi:uncharacterized protein (TIGR03905 family)